jgi:succinyl-CoA:(S)-malate CoA-transferase subunit B
VYPDHGDDADTLIKDADVLVENFQPGTLEKWGLGWDVLKEVNPKLIMVRISGYGQTGPYSPRPGFGRIGNAFGGLSYLAGYPDRPPVTPGSATIPDYLAGLYGALGVLLCIQALQKTGRGQVVDIGLYEPIFRILDEIAPSYHMKGYVRERMGPGTVNVVPHSHYPTKDDKWIAIACTSDKIFERLALAMGVPEFGGDGKWGTITQREAERAVVDDFVGAWTSTLTREQVLSTCESFQVPCGSVYSIDEIFVDPQYAARENIKYMKDAFGKEHAIPNLVPRLTDTPGKIRSLGPALGQHNDEVFRGRLGLSAERIAELVNKGVI